MGTDVVSTAYGPAAHEELRRQVARLKDGDPLAPVTVIVSSNYLGVAARRALGRAGGVAAVNFLTVYRLAELLGSARLAATGRRPVSTPVLAGAVRAVLHADPGHFRGVHTHPATERSLVQAHRDLSEVDGAGLDRLARRSTRAADVVRIHRAILDHLADQFTDERDLTAAAIAARPDHRDDLGPIVVFLPQRLTTNQCRLLAEFEDLTVIVGDSGDPEADAAVHQILVRLGAEPPASAHLPPTAGRGISVSDADEEVRHAVRALLDATRAGTHLGRCAIVYGTADPYARLLADALDGAGVPWYGASVRTAETSLLGRSLTALLSLGDHDFARTDVTAWLAGSPVRGVDDRPVPAARWERLSRSAGVVAGVDQWKQRLDRLATDLERDAGRHEIDDEESWRAARARRDAAWTRELSEFVERLAGDLSPGSRSDSWSGLATWCGGLIRRYLGGDALRAGWPDDELRAAHRVEAAVERLGDLDGVDPAPSVIAFRRALQLELGDDLGRHGTFGHGVLVGPLSMAVGLELDEVVILGLAEGSLPARRRDDALIPDRERRVVGSDLPLRSMRLHDDHRALLAVLAAAVSSTYIFPRGDLRRSSERAPSRWFLESEEAAGPGWRTTVPSFVAGIRTVAFPATAQEYDVRALLSAVDSGTDIAAGPIATGRAEVRRGIDLVIGRGSRRFTRFDGNLGAGDLRGGAVPRPWDADQVVSATRLESWAKCPHSYFVRHVLGVYAVEDPDDGDRASPLDVGSLVHEALEIWLREAIEADAVPAPNEPWSAAARARLVELGTAACDRLEARGLAGRMLYWQRDRRRILDNLERFTEYDDGHRRAGGRTPIAAELGFGVPGADGPPVEIDLPDGRTLRLRGSIDRVDEIDGGLAVIDYKSGSARNFKKLGVENPAPGGTHLQLVLYAAAARRQLDRPAASLRGDYWFVHPKTGERHNDPAGYPISPDVEANVLEVVERIIDGIARGVFPAHPAEPGFRMWVDCEYCEPDGLGLRHQYRDWLRIRDDPSLVAYLAVAEPDLLVLAEAGSDDD